MKRDIWNLKEDFSTKTDTPKQILPIVIPYNKIGIELASSWKVNFLTKTPDSSHHYRAMLCIRGTSHGPVSVCVCLSVSVTSRTSTKTAKRRIIQTTPHDSPGDSSFLVPKISTKFDRGHPLRGRRMQVGWVKIGDF